MSWFKLIVAFLFVALGLRWVWDFLHSITWSEFITPVRRGFYAACAAALAFYLARLVRAFALYWEARAEKETEDV